MHHQTEVTTSGKYKYDNSFELLGLSQDSSIFEGRITPDLILDNISVWFIQIKAGTKLKNMLVNSGLDEINDKEICANISQIIKKITTNFSFRFTSNELADSVFRKSF